MSSKSRARLLAAFVLTLASSPLLAASPDPWDAKPFTAEPKAMLEAAQNIPAGETAVVVLLDEDRYTFDREGHATSERRLVYYVAGESAVDDWSTIDALWAPWVQDRPVIEARVIAKDGSVHNLDPKALIEAPSPEESLDIFSDNRILRAPLPAVAAGSVVEQLITYHDKNPLFAAGTTGHYYFGRWVPVHQSRLVIEAPSSVPLKIVNKSAPAIEPRKEETGGVQRLTFESGPIKAIEHMEFALPYDTSARPYIAFSTGASWQELARRYSDIVDKQIASGSLQKQVREAMGTSSKRDDVVAKLLAAIQKDVRYAGVEIGESSIVPRTPQEVLSHKYGDCKDKATLLVAMLREAGIPAHVALLRAGGDLDVNPDLPGLGEFNHAIVVIDGEKPLWVDPTDEFARAGELPVMDQGRMALIADVKTSSLTATPTYEAPANHIVETRVFNLSEEGKAAVVETTEGSGPADSSQRRFFAQTDSKKYRESMETYARGAYAAKSLKDLKTTDPHDLSKPFRLELQIVDAARGSTADGEGAVAIFPTGLTDNLPWPLRAGFDDNNEDDSSRNSAKYHPREHDFVFAAPYVKEWHYRIVPPPGYAARTLPPNDTTKLGTATLTSEYKTDANGVVLANLTFDSGKRRLTASEFEAMRKALHELDQSKAVLIGFEQIGQTKLNAGDVGGALSEYRKLITLHPQEGRHHAEIARALLAGGMGAAAREEIKRAIAIEPNYARAWYTEGLILQHDLLGRPYRKGCDIKGAVASLRKAKELDPKQIEYRAELGKLLQYDESGELFGPTAPIDQAIAEYRAAKADLKDERLDGELILALAHAGKFAELRELAKDLKNTRQRDMSRIIAAAALDGSAAALREAGAADNSERKAMLEGAAGILLSVRIYPQAADLLEAAIEGATNKNEQRTQVAVLRKAKRWEDVPMPENDPKSVALRMVADLFLKHGKTKELDKYFPKAMKDDAPDEDEISRYDALAGSLSILRAQIGRQQVPMSVIVDMATAAIQWQQDGNDETGYRIRMRAVGDNSSRRGAQMFFIMKEDGHYVIAGTDALPDMTGSSVLQLVKNGKLEAARTWLNWLREDMQAAGGDDPLDGAPFPRLWPKGKQTATADEIKTAAASLMLRKMYIADAKPILAAAEEKATGDVKSSLDVALSVLAIAEKDWKSLDTLSERLVTNNPDSPSAFNTRITALVETGKAKEAIALSNKRLERLPKDRDALRALGRTAMHDGDYAGCDTYYKTIIDESTPNAGDYNNRAWNALFLGKNLVAALEDARQASTLSGGGPAALHTLAALYAETGKSLEGREALLESMDNAGREEPAAHDWYVLGRIAENYGALDAALAAYKKVKPEEDANESTYLLAQRRLAVLKK